MARPDSAQLAAAVREFLLEDILPALDDKALAYQVRVAANVLAVVQREAEQGAALAALENRELAELLGQAGETGTLRRALIRRIEAGDLNVDSPTLLDALEAISLAKIAVDNPRYSTARRLGEEES